MNSYIFISLVAVLVNMVLSSVVPCLLENSNQPFINDVKKVFNNNKQIILVNSIILGVTVYIALLIAPSLNSSLSNLNGIFTTDNLYQPQYGNNNFNGFNDDKMDAFKYLFKLKQ